MIGTLSRYIDDTHDLMSRLNPGSYLYGAAQRWVEALEGEIEYLLQEEADRLAEEDYNSAMYGNSVGQVV